MAGTPLNEVFDLFLQTCTDYRLTTLLETSEVDFENYVESWLIFSINEFVICDQSLVYDSLTKIFTETLTLNNKVVLATLMMKYWLQKDVNDVTQFRLHIIDRDFKTPSEAQNLKEKTIHLNIIKEQCSQMLNDYGYKRNDWAQWFTQDFAGM